MALLFIGNKSSQVQQILVPEASTFMLEIILSQEQDPINRIITITSNLRFSDWKGVVFSRRIQEHVCLYNIQTKVFQRIHLYLKREIYQSETITCWKGKSFNYLD